jgi:hypothetical protein
MACLQRYRLVVSSVREDKVFVITQPVALGEVAVMLWLAIMGAKEKGLPAAA